MNKLKFFILFFLLIASKAIAEEPFWDYLNAPETGLVRQIIVSNDNEVLIASANGIYKFDSEADSWNNVTYESDYRNDYLKLFISRKNVLITKKMSFSDNYGLYKSLDCGKKWEKIKNPEMIIFPDIIGIDTNEVIYVYDYNKRDSLEYIFSSSDFGETWINKKIVLDDIKEKRAVKSFGITKTNEIYFLAQCNDSDKNFDWIIGISSDGGSNWQYHKFNYNLDTYLTFIMSTYKVVNKEKIIFSKRKEMQYTLDGGKTWKINQYPVDNVGFLFISSQSEIYIGNIKWGSGIYFSSDYGETWEKRCDGLENYYIYSFAEDSVGNVYIGTAHGIFSTTNKGKSWKILNKGFTSADMQDITFDNKGNVYGVSSIGVFKSANDGKNWSNLGLNLQPMSSLAINKEGYIFVPGWFGHLFRTSNDGKSWDTITNGIPDNISFTSLIINQRGHILASNPFSGYYLSTDNGDTWEEKDQNGVQTCLLGVNNMKHIFRADDWGRISRSTDDGDTWHQVGFGDCHGGYLCSPNGIVFDPFGSLGWIGCMKTIDNGSSWHVMVQYEKQGPSCIDTLGNYWDLVDIIKTKKSIDKGETWIIVDSSLKHSKFNFLKVAPNGYIYAAACNGGLYRSRDRFVSVEEENPKQTSDEIICNPNPVHDYLEITKPSEGSSNAVKIFNVFGEIVKNPTPTLPEGEGIRIDVSGLSPGVYFVRVGGKVGKFVKI